MYGFMIDIFCYLYGRSFAQFAHLARGGYLIWYNYCRKVSSHHCNAVIDRHSCYDLMSIYLNDIDLIQFLFSLILNCNAQCFVCYLLLFKPSSVLIQSANSSWNCPLQFLVVQEFL